MNVAEKPILYSDQMLKARDEGRKTQTRRVITPQPPKPNPPFCCKLAYDYPVDKLGIWYEEYKDILYLKAKYQVGDRMLIKEDYKYWISERIVYVEYKTSYPEGKGHELRTYQFDSLNKKIQGKLFSGIQNVWKSKLSMFNFMVRKKDLVTNVRVEQIQDISYEDCLAEGINTSEMPTVREILVKQKFIHLWDSINAKRGYSWESNPWVFVYDFKRVQ